MKNRRISGSNSLFSIEFELEYQNWRTSSQVESKWELAQGYVMKLLKFLTTAGLLALALQGVAQNSCRSVYSQVSFSAARSYPDVDSKLLLQLSSISQINLSRRTPEMKSIWERYKNTPGSQSALIDLTDSSLFSPSDLLNNRHSDIQYTKYDEAITLLRKGDRLKIGDQIYTLGDYLGSGHTTHIYANADHPETVIRVPYVIHQMIKSIMVSELMRKQQPESLWKDPKTRILFGWFLNELQQDLNTRPHSAKLRFLDSQGRIAVVDRVYGSETAQDFIEPLLSPNGKLAQRDQSTISYPDSAMNVLMSKNQFLPVYTLSPESVKKINLLMDTLVANGHATKERYLYKFKTQILRQYLFDETLQQWKFVDGEPFTLDQLPEAFKSFLQKFKDLH
jgi:hypothetical protein